MVVDAERAGGGQRVGDVDCEVAGVALLAVGAGPGEADADGVGLADLRRLPDVLVEAADAAVERVRAVVGRELVRSAVDREPAAGDPVGVAADEGAEVGLDVVLDVVVEGAEAESDVGDPAGTVGNADGLDDAAKGEERDLDRAVGKGVDLNGFAIDIAKCILTSPPTSLPLPLPPPPPLLPFPPLEIQTWVNHCVVPSSVGRLAGAWRAAARRASWAMVDVGGIRELSQRQSHALQ